MDIRIQLPTRLARLQGDALRGVVRSEAAVRPDSRPRPGDQVVARANADRERLLLEQLAGPARRRF